MSVFGIDILMPSLTNDLSLQLPIADILPGNPFNTPQFINSQATPRFFANGTAIIVDGIPEPNVLTLLGVGLVAISAPTAVDIKFARDQVEKLYPQV